MTDQPDDPRKRYPPPMFAPAAPGAELEPEPEPEPQPEPAAPSVVSGEISAGAAAAEAAPVPAASAAATPAEEPLLPASYRAGDLRAAVGSPPGPEQIRPTRRRRSERDELDDDLDEDRPAGRRTALVVVATLLLGGGVGALVILGKLNASRYLVSCEAKEVVARQGRVFPPWGTRRRGGDEWKPIPIPASFQCVGLETEDPTELGDAYRKLLVERAEALLTAKEVTQIEPAAEMLEQALLHARTDSEPHKNARQVIQRMLGDVGYWRASIKLQKAAAELSDAAKQFEAAAGQRPRFVSDSNAWATHVRRLVDDLRAGPAGARALAGPEAPASPSTSPERPPAPAGVALPVEPTPPAAGAGGGSGNSAGSGARPAPPPPAAVPSGGVLL